MTFKSLPENFFFSSSDKPDAEASAEMQMLRDGRHFTDADALIRTKEAQAHLQEIREAFGDREDFVERESDNS